MLEDCTDFLAILDSKTPNTIKNYENFKYQLRKRMESNLYRDPSIWKYSLSEISFLVQRYIRPYYFENEQCKQICDHFKVLIDKAK